MRAKSQESEASILNDAKLGSSYRHRPKGESHLSIIIIVIIIVIINVIMIMMIMLR